MFPIFKLKYYFYNVKYGLFKKGPVYFNHNGEK